MNIVILHCHFERGGVTQVVENHVRALRESDSIGRIVLVGGNRFGGLSDKTRESVEQVSIPSFDYDDLAHENPARENLAHDDAAQGDDRDAIGRRAEGMVRSLTQEFSRLSISSDDSILHWHNHSLGKNTAVPDVIGRLAEAGWRLLLQIHDFAEDNRPENYRRLIDASGAKRKPHLDAYLYPVAAQIHYATLTRGDAATLVDVGVPGHQTHCLPNSVVAPSGEPPPRHEALERVRRELKLPPDAQWCLYPVRGIRRKNVGEFLLLSRWTRPNHFAGLTLCPATPVERRSYLRWKEIASVVAPRAVFDAGQHPHVSFLDNMSAAEFVASSSVAEGFGMAYLEPWLVHREVIARRLPTVTDDFEASGVDLPKLYDAIFIPGDRVWVSECMNESAVAMEQAWSKIPESFQPQFRARATENEGQIDFAELIPARQAEVLRRVASDAGFESEIKACATKLVDDLTRTADEGLLRRNAEIVRCKYSPEKTAEHLKSIYESLSQAPIDSEVFAPQGAMRAVDRINRSRPFYPCRTEVLDE